MASVTSLAAYRSPTAAHATNEELILEVIEKAGAGGAIMDEVRAALPGIPAPSVSPRFSKLIQEGKIYRGLDTRTGSTGHQQTVMRAIKWLTIHTGGAAKPRSRPTGFQAGAIFITKVLMKAPDLASAKRAVADELKRMALA